MRAISLLLTMTLLTAAGCQDKGGASSTAAPASSAPKKAPEPPPPPPAPPPAAAAGPTEADTKEATEIYSMRCVPCHGATGAGDGPASAALTPKPASFASAEWQAKVTDEHVEKVILYGGAAVGKSAAMPSNPDLASKEGVVKALRAHVRSLKK